MDSSVVALLGVAVVLFVVAYRLIGSLPQLPQRLTRPAAIVSGGMFGLAVALPLAVVLNPWVGMQAGTFFNLMILAMCLGFLGFIVGSLGGLIHGGMILTASSRTTDAGAVQPMDAQTVVASPDPSENARQQPSGPSFLSVLADAEHPQKPKNHENSGGEG